MSTKILVISFKDIEMVKFWHWYLYWFPIYMGLSPEGKSLEGKSPKGEAQREKPKGEKPKGRSPEGRSPMGEAYVQPSQ